MPERAAEKTLAGQLRFQAEACAHLGSPLYGGLLQGATADLVAGGPTWEVLRGHEHDPVESALALRLMGAVNRLVLAGRAPALANVYSDPGTDPAVAWETFRAVLEHNTEELRELVLLPVQTNEVGRCAGLLFGFLTVAAESALPLRLLEVGASAGLNLRWDRYRYLAGGLAWGPIDSPVRIEFELNGEPPVPPAGVEIRERRGCDAVPIDPATEDGRLSLLAYVWPDQTARIERMKAALRIAREAPLSVERETAAPWTERMLAEPARGQATILYHSIVSQYLPEEELRAFHRHIQAAGARAERDAPLAWLRMEPAGAWADLHLTVWPGGEERCLAHVGYHGNPVTVAG